MVDIFLSEEYPVEFQTLTDGAIKKVRIRRKITVPMGSSPAWAKSFPTGRF